MLNTMSRDHVKCHNCGLPQYSVFSNCSSTVTVSPSGPPGLFKGVTTAMSVAPNHWVDRYPNADILVTSLVLKHCAHALSQPRG